MGASTLPVTGAGIGELAGLAAYALMIPAGGLLVATDLRRRNSR